MTEELHPGDKVRARYDVLAAEGKLDPDPAQEALASRLDALNEEIASLRLASKSSSLGWLFAKRAPKPQSPSTRGPKRTRSASSSS